MEYKQELRFGLIGVGAIVASFGIMNIQALKPIFSYNYLLTAIVGVGLMILAGRVK